MTSAWLLPEHIADVLPAQARRIETLRRRLLDLVDSYGFEQVTPPLLEHLESLLSGAGHALDLQTFKLIDQLSGRSLGLRADVTTQVARIDAHMLNRRGVTRLSYCAPVLHTRPVGLNASREPLQFGAEIYGHPGLEADLEVVDLALDALRMAGIDRPVLDLGDVRVVRAIAEAAGLSGADLSAVVSALAAKNEGALEAACTAMADDARNALRELLGLYGGVEVLELAPKRLPPHALIEQALTELASLTQQVQAVHPEVEITIDLADLSGWGYYSGMRFALYDARANDALVRGGRYDAVGALFGRRRPAVGFSLDLKDLTAYAASAPTRSAVSAPWHDDATLRQAVRALRARGETVVCLPAGQAPESTEFDLDRELVAVGDQWVLRAR